MDIPLFVDRARTLELRGPSLTLRRFRAEDLPIALSHQLDPRIMRFVQTMPTREEALAKVERLVDPWGGADGEWLGLALVPHAVGSMVGLLGVRVVVAVNESVEIGYRLHPDHHRRGYAFEACQLVLDFLFDTVGTRKVIAHCVAANEPSYRLMEKLGMQREGCHRRHSMIGDTWHDELHYGLFADERRPANRAPMSSKTE